MAEKIILRTLLLDYELWDRVWNQINENDFLNTEHQLIFRAISSLANRGDPFDIITVSEWLEDRKLLDKVGGFAALGSLVSIKVVNVDIVAWARFLRVTARRKQMKEGVIRGAKDSGVDTD